jgi:hypothetical protein
MRTLKKTSAATKRHNKDTTYDKYRNSYAMSLTIGGMFQAEYEGEHQHSKLCPSASSQPDLARPPQIFACW